MRGLSGKVYVVAGAATGIGAATAARLATEGANVVVGDIDRAQAEQTAATIRASGGNARAVEFDLADEDSVRQLIDATVDTHGYLDGVHCNGADLFPETIGRDTDAVDIPIEVWDRTLAVNLRGFLFAARYAIPRLTDRGGAIVMTTSAAAFYGEPQRVAYASAKAGITALVRHVANRWGPTGIRCNGIAPGLVLSEAALAAAGDQFSQQMREQVPIRRLGTPDDIAAMVSFLFSDDGAWITGQTYSVDGGAVLR